MSRPIRVLCLDDARAAVAAADGAPVRLVSAPDAGGALGAGGWRALLDAITAEFPGARVTAVLDCGDAAGHAIAALALGIPDVAFSGDAAAAARLADIAQSLGAHLHPAEGVEALDLRGRRDPVAASRAWLTRI
ncbi:MULTISPECIES: hypothetical protein [Nitrospirillum]|uniref:Uncharacterized protein n=1 Tax=Nitrospirillum amazonense TaxID=28077 RepID=A0A560FZQ9_9PROT|nr:hypothetical protein [Nitrospirillum amazonense]MEC4591109.1 hypothetical protein [Nitrospirillum amazonense]TWB27082.1 hypothetical protein FBZ88_107252 [Nitrospirillum amazonense]